MIHLSNRVLRNLTFAMLVVVTGNQVFAGGGRGGSRGGGRPAQPSTNFRNLSPRNRPSTPNFPSNNGSHSRSNSNASMKPRAENTVRIPTYNTAPVLNNSHSTVTNSLPKLNLGSSTVATNNSTMGQTNRNTIHHKHGLHRFPKLCVVAGVLTASACTDVVAEDTDPGIELEGEFISNEDITLVDTEVTQPETLDNELVIETDSLNTESETQTVVESCPNLTFTVHNTTNSPMQFVVAPSEPDCVIYTLEPGYCQKFALTGEEVEFGYYPDQGYQIVTIPAGHVYAFADVAGTVQLCEADESGLSAD